MALSDRDEWLVGLKLVRLKQSKGVFCFFAEVFNKCRGFAGRLKCFCV